MENAGAHARGHAAGHLSLDGDLESAESIRSSGIPGSGAHLTLLFRVGWSGLRSTGTLPVIKTTARASPAAYRCVGPVVAEASGCGNDNGDWHPDPLRSRRQWREEWAKGVVTSRPPGKDRPDRRRRKRPRLPVAAASSDRTPAKLRGVPAVSVDLLQERAGSDPALDLALSTALLQMVAAGERGPALRCYRPLPTVAFSRRDTFLPGFDRAVAAARGHGFTPVIRAAGGRAAAYDEGCLILDEIMPALDSMAAIRDRFADGAALQAAALRSLGVDARVGEVAGEYCPGEFSVNARGSVKLIGSAQRIIRGGWLFAAVVVVSSADTLGPVLEEVYAALGLDWDPATTGSVAAEAPGTSAADVQRALLERYAERYRLAPAAPDAAAIRRAVHQVNAKTGGAAIARPAAERKM